MVKDIKNLREKANKVFEKSINNYYKDYIDLSKEILIRLYLKLQKNDYDVYEMSSASGYVTQECDNSILCCSLGCNVYTFDLCYYYNYHNIDEISSDSKNIVKIVNMLYKHIIKDIDVKNNFIIGLYTITINDNLGLTLKADVVNKEHALKIAKPLTSNDALSNI